MREAAIVAQIFHIDPVVVLEESSQTRHLARLAAASIIVQERQALAAQE